MLMSQVETFRYWALKTPHFDEFVLVIAVEQCVSGWRSRPVIE
jgi:hypothetical protein